MKFKNKLIALGVAVIATFSFALISQDASADTRAQGVDWSKYQGNNGIKGYKNDQFVIAQIGGITPSGIYSQQTYNSQIASAKKAGLHAHSYVWLEAGSSKAQVKRALGHFLPLIKTPKGSIVALDYEAGASGSKQGNTDAIKYGMKLIKKAGYTPMYYSYKPYTMEHVYYKQILAEFPDSFWIAAYRDYNVATVPDYNFFPSLPGVAIWQFTSMYRVVGYVGGNPIGLDGNVDLTGITKNGYTNKPAKAVKKPAAKKTVKKSKAKVTTTESYTQKGVFKPNRTLGVYTSLNSTKPTAHYYKGESVAYRKVFIRSNKGVWAQYKSYSGAKHYVKMGVMGGKSYGSRTTGAKTAHVYYKVKYGDSLWAIANKHGITINQLCSLNGLRTNSVIHPEQAVLVR